MAAYILWFLLAFLLLAAEMATGTFYLLVLALALASGGVAALFDVPPSMQITLCAVVGIIGTVILRRSKFIRPEPLENQNLNIGQLVRVLQWHEGGTLRVFYRGAEWDAELEAADTPRDQPLFIHAMRGSTLILSHHNPHH
ncbi:MAG: NfeD family protein [Gammaproteobacteria bacterium]|nr:NfeD family protein [Gammaproteobacteria bacterium]